METKIECKFEYTSLNALIFLTISYKHLEDELCHPVFYYLLHLTESSTPSRVSINTCRVNGRKFLFLMLLLAMNKGCVVLASSI